jgi:quercetin dioxygenase-like cupin family protein
MTLNIRWTAILATSAAMLAATPAIAGTGPAGQTAANALAGVPTAPVKVTDTVIGSVDLQKEINVDNRDLRMRRLVVQPGGIVPLHSHAGRPALIIVVSGSITEYRSTCAVGILHKAGELAREADGISHWWKNTSKVPAVLLSADVKARD